MIKKNLKKIVTLLIVGGIIMGNTTYAHAGEITFNASRTSSPASATASAYKGGTTMELKLYMCTRTQTGGTAEYTENFRGGICAGSASGKIGPKANETYRIGYAVGRAFASGTGNLTEELYNIL